ncbi:alpha/beta hydrolase [Shewanella corallii]|uniref:Alpha/beta hydrolase n=1 Tax=Shewanella corallii TaxID=560080 RepID=A0ABT0NDQ9_9GAMM|nr:alpha/beta hydrolase [Shewanella corallii]MCL2916589.1 alpha/beta hydrolase [Shewanella corallii]
MTIDAVVIEPPAEANAAVIWLHGLGDSGDGFAPIVPAFNLGGAHGIRFVFPNAPEQAVTINNGYIMRSWYDIKSMNLLERADLAGVLESEKRVRALIEDQIAKGIPSERIILAGFSQGGVMTLFTALRLEYKLAGILALSCYLPGGDKLPDGLHEANKETPILQMHGEQDDVVPKSAGRLANHALVQGGYRSSWLTYPMGHSVHPEQIVAIRNWLMTRF